MTLDDAIKHCQQVANKSDCECAKEHKQLAEWLQELKEFKKMQTNEEWFCQLPTEENAETVAQLSSYGGNVEAILDWLKEIHKE